MNVFELFGKIAIDSSGAEKGLNKTLRHAKDTESKLATVFKKIGTAAAAALSVRAIVDFGKQCTQAYATIAAEESAFAQIMGDYSATAQAKLDAVAAQTGVTSTRMTGAMTSLTAKFKGLGYDVEDATTLAADGLLIASDAAAFWDMSLDESMSHLNSFINGSYEGGEAIGLFANDTQMAAYAVEQGIVKSTKQWAKLDEATKQATRLDYAKKMMENSGATGQAAKEADAYANVMANLKESWRQFQGVVGKPILEKLVLPAMKKLNDFMPKLTEGVQKGIEWFEFGFKKFKGYFTEVFTEDGIKWEALPDALTNMFRDLGESAGKLLKKFGQTLRLGWSNTVWPAIQGVAAKIGIELPEWSEIETKVTTWWADMNKSVSAACTWTLNLFSPPEESGEETASALETWWKTAKPYVQSACEWTLNVFKNPPEVTAEQVEAIMDTWWATTKGYVQSACDWVLKTFSPPAEETAEGVSSKLSSWWTNTQKYVQDACQWTLKLFNNPTEDQTAVANGIKGWWDAICATVEGACTWTLKMFNKPKETSTDVETEVKSWWDGLDKTNLNNIIKLGAGFDFPGLEDAKKAVMDWWNGIKDQITIKLSTVFPKLFGGDDTEEPTLENWKPMESSFSLPEDTGGKGGSGGTGGWNPGRPMWHIPEMKFGTQGGENSLPNVIAAAVREAAREGAREGSAAGCAEGVGNIQITGNVSTGNVMLDGNTLVGRLTPRINLALGGTMARAAMRNPNP